MSLAEAPTSTTRSWCTDGSDSRTAFADTDRDQWSSDKKDYTHFCQLTEQNCVKLLHLESQVSNVLWSLSQDQNHGLRLPLKLGKTDALNHFDAGSTSPGFRRRLLQPDAEDVSLNSCGNERFKPMLAACADLQSSLQPIQVQDEVKQMEEQLREELGGRLEQIAEELAAAKTDSSIALQELSFAVKAIKSCEGHERLGNSTHAQGDRELLKLEVERAMEAMHLSLQKQREMISEERNHRLMVSKETAALRLKVQALEHQMKQVAGQFSEMHVDIRELSVDLSSVKAASQDQAEGLRSSDSLLAALSGQVTELEATADVLGSKTAKDFNFLKEVMEGQANDLRCNDALIATISARVEELDAAMSSHASLPEAVAAQKTAEAAAAATAGKAELLAEAQHLVQSTEDCWNTKFASLRNDINILLQSMSVMQAGQAAANQRLQSVSGSVSDIFAQVVQQAGSRLFDGKAECAQVTDDGKDSKPMLPDSSCLVSQPTMAQTQTQASAQDHRSRGESLALGHSQRVEHRKEESLDDAFSPIKAMRTELHGVQVALTRVADVRTELQTMQVAMARLADERMMAAQAHFNADLHNVRELLSESMSRIPQQSHHQPNKETTQHQPLRQVVQRQQQQQEQQQQQQQLPHQQIPQQQVPPLLVQQVAKRAQPQPSPRQSSVTTLEPDPLQLPQPKLQPSERISQQMTQSPPPPVKRQLSPHGCCTPDITLACGNPQRLHRSGSFSTALTVSPWSTRGNTSAPEVSTRRSLPARSRVSTSAVLPAGRALMQDSLVSGPQNVARSNLQTVQLDGETARQAVSMLSQPMPPGHTSTDLPQTQARSLVASLVTSGTCSPCTRPRSLSPNVPALNPSVPVFAARCYSRSSEGIQASAGSLRN